MPHSNPIQIQKYLKGVDYPAKKSELIKHAKDQGADDNVCASLEQLPDESFQTPAEVSQAFKGPSTDDVDSAQGKAGTKAAPAGEKTDHDTSQFLKQVMQDSIAEVEMCVVALKKTVSPELKEFAQHLIDDHGKFGHELEQLAKKKQVSLPKKMDARHKETLDKFSHLKPEQLDQQFLEKNIEYHDNDLKVFKHYAKDADDEDIKKFAESGAHLFSKHLKMAKDLEKKRKH